MLKKVLLFTLLACCLLSTNAFAKWWIFGQSEENVSTRYLYLNDISFGELDEKVTLYSDMLPAGRLILRGKAQQGKSKIGKVEVSLDKKETWQPAAKSDDGSFEFSFVPETNRTYQLYVKILDTSGKSNEVDETYREITISDADIDSTIRQALDAMIRAYQTEDPRNFMDYVDENFAGDAVALDRAIRKDFTAFDALNLTYTLNNVASSSSGKVFVAISYNRQVTSALSGETLTDRGLTEFIFKLTAGHAKVSAMKNPLIFGLSEASEVGTGTVNSAENDEVLIVDETGSIRLGSVNDAASGADSSFPTPSGLAVTNFIPHHAISLSFSVSPNVVGSANYEMVLQEALTSSGPWTEVYRTALATNTITNFTSVNIASNPADLYFQVLVERISDAEQSDPSNIVMVDNH